MLDRSQCRNLVSSYPFVVFMHVCKVHNSSLSAASRVASFPGSSPVCNKKLHGEELGNKATPELLFPDFYTSWELFTAFSIGSTHGHNDSRMDTIMEQQQK